MSLNQKYRLLIRARCHFSCSCCEPILIHFIILFTGTNVCNIIQLAAVCGVHTFNRYTVPMEALTKDVTDLTGFTVHGSCLYRNGYPVPTIPLKDLLIHFIDYLDNFHHPILVAHNALHFDVPVLMRVLEENGLKQQFTQVVSGFVDTYQLSKHIYPGLPRGYSLKALVKQFLGQQFDAHNAEEDAKILEKLFYKWNPNDCYVKMFTYSFE